MVPALKGLDISFFNLTEQTFKLCASIELGMWATVSANTRPWQQAEERKEDSYKKEMEGGPHSPGM